MVRSALGASRARLLRQFLTENVMIALVGGALGVSLAYVLLGVLLRSVAAYEMPFGLPIAIDSRALLFTGALSFTCGVAFGLVPAFSTTRAGFSEALKEDGRSARVSRGGRR
jgi:putative ABC transport system permease protein